MPRTMSTKTNQTFEISLLIKPDASQLVDLLKTVLLSLGVPLSAIVEQVGVKRDTYRLAVYFPSKEKAGAFTRQIRCLKLSDVTIQSKVLYRKDWQDRWKENIRPFRLTKNFDVVPAWNKKGYQKNRRIPLYINTTMAFGTGLHETTRFMAQLIDESRDQFDSFLDIGTGTGLLSLVAYRCGARDVCAIDIDPESIRVAHRNVEANGYRLPDARVVDFKKFKSKKYFDFVAANLVTHDLIAMRRKITSRVKPGKYLAVSGISLPNLRKLRKAFRDMPLRCCRVLKGKEWAAVLYQRTPAKGK